MNVNKLLRLFHTIKYLKCRQFSYRIFYILRKRLRSISGYRYTLSIPSTTTSLRLQPSLSSAVSFKGETFTFLNLSHTFNGAIDWNCSELGKLWTYNLTYFNFLQQEGLSKEEGLVLIHDFMDRIACMKDALEPFPISLRGINWIKFLISHNIKEQTIGDSLYAQYSILLDNLEYHLQGNHLLENGFSLLFGSYYFQDEKLYKKAKDILESELEEQILDDGAHFELSPMYHQLMLYRLLDCINLLQNNSWNNNILLALLEGKAAMMLGWLHNITYSGGDIPLLNDSANNIAPTMKQLNDYAKILNVNARHQPLKESGYRKIKGTHYEMIVDVGNIGPDYIPGHAHADTFNFELYINNKPFIVDIGLSTYEANKRRQLERSTKSHNTVVVDGLDQSEVWGGFRVADRAKIIYLYENDNVIEATHNGYKKIGALHTRKFVSSLEQIGVFDNIDSKKIHECFAYLHFHPDIIVQKGDSSLITDEAVIHFQDYTDVQLGEYEYAVEFNKTHKAQYAMVRFDRKLSTVILIVKKTNRVI